MKPRTTNQLSDLLDNEMSWRRRELVTLRQTVENARDHELPLVLRAGVLLLYAHWEGFVKQTAQYYLEYVAAQRLQYKDLQENFLAHVMHGRIVQFYESKKATFHVEFFKFLRQRMSDTAPLENYCTVNTQANLNSDVFKEIVNTLGLNYKDYELKEKLIDYRLLKNRNEIAHGEASLIDRADFYLLYNEIMAIMEDFRTQIINSAVLNSYKVA